MAEEGLFQNPLQFAELFSYSWPN